MKETNCKKLRFNSYCQSIANNFQSLKGLLRVNSRHHIDLFPCKTADEVDIQYLDDC